MRTALCKSQQKRARGDQHRCIFHPVRLTCPARLVLQYHCYYSTTSYGQILGIWNSTIIFCYSNQPLQYLHHYGTPPLHKLTPASRSSPACRHLTAPPVNVLGRVDLRPHVGQFLSWRTLIVASFSSIQLRFIHHMVMVVAASHSDSLCYCDSAS